MDSVATVCGAYELISRRQFIPLQPTNLTAFPRLFSGLYPALEHTSIVGGPYIVPELVSNFIEKLPQCSALISMRLLQTRECFFSYIVRVWLSTLQGGKKMVA